MNGIDEHTSDVECVRHSGIIWKLRVDSFVEEDITSDSECLSCEVYTRFHFTFLENQ